MAKAVAVVGLGFGDEGKGSVVEALAKPAKDCLVVKFSGGAQSAHNVVLEDGRHHTFAQFGSGTFSGAKTLLSQHMLVNPLALMEEKRHLESLGVSLEGLMHVDYAALVTNPFQVAANRLREMSRNPNSKHGSCGMGIGETMADLESHPDLALRVGNLFSGKDVREILHESRRLKCAEMAAFVAMADLYDSPEWAMLMDEGAVDACVPRYCDFADWVETVDESFLHDVLRKDGLVLFEGSQGVLLDQDYGFFPYVTRSNVTFNNALDLLNGHTVTKMGVIRTYLTRHGMGPFPTEDPKLHYAENHNNFGRWQGSFKQGHFDAVLFDYAVRALGGVDQIALTHCDRPPQKVCVEYDGMGYDGPSGLPIPANRNTQTILTHILKQAAPKYETSVSTETLLELLNKKAPVTLMSYGPFAKDKAMHWELCTKEAL
jgi:adenylosuccinate synthase